MSVTRMNNFDAALGKQDELRDVLRGVVALVQTLDGCESCHLLRDAKEAHRFLIVEVWASIAHHQAAAQAIPRDKIAQVMPLLAAPPRGSYYETDRAY